LQDHLKERLTGAAILVVVVVLLVPEMFRGRPAGGAEHGAAGPEGAPVRTYNIDLRDSPAAQPPAVTAQPAAPAPTSTPAPTAAAAPAMSVGQPAVPSVAPAIALSAPSGAAPAAATAPKSTAVAAGSGWTGQVHALGFRVEAVGPDDRGLFRVRSAPMADRAAALALKQKMQARGLKPIVNAAP
jgi:cell division septation protein DedD